MSSQWAKMTFLVLFLWASAASGEEPLSKTSDYYRPSDFYYFDKAGNKVILVPNPRKIVIYIGGVEDGPSKIKAVLTDQRLFALTEKDIERIDKFETLLGTREVKSVIKKDTFYLVTFRDNVDVISVINTLATVDKVIEAYPVFKMGDETVFPGGVWLKLKPLDTNHAWQIEQKISMVGYNPSWRTIPPGMEPRLHHYFKSSDSMRKDFINPLRLSRLLAQDLAAEYSIPDLVPVKSTISIELVKSRLSGTLGDTYIISYRVAYNENLIEPDWNSLKNAQANDFRPESVFEKFFKLYRVSLVKEKSAMVVEISFTVFQKGKIAFKPQSLTYNLKGASPDVPPLTVEFPETAISVVGLVPRDDSGKPLIKDIFPWKRMALPSVTAEEKPKREAFPKTDIRFWTNNAATQYPRLADYAANTAKILIAGPIAILGLVFFVKLFKLAKTGKRDPRRKVFVSAWRKIEGGGEEKNMSHFASASLSELRRLLSLTEGVTERQIRKLASRAEVVDVLTLIENLRTDPAAVKPAEVKSAIAKLRLKIFFWRLRGQKATTGRS